MRVASIVAVSLAVLLPSGPALAQEDPKKKAELKWAKELVSDFFSAAGGGKSSLARELLTEGMREKMPIPSELWTPLIYSPTVTFTTEEILIDQDEAVFRGSLKHKDKEYTFVVRVVKGTDQRVWRICYVQAVEQKKSK